MPHWVDFLQIQFDKHPKQTNQHIDKPRVDVRNRKQAPQSPDQTNWNWIWNDIWKFYDETEISMTK